MKTIIAVNGACGRMGQRIVQLAHEDKELTIGAAIDAPSHPRQGQDIGEIAGLGKIGVPLTSQVPLNPHPHVVIDFSTPEGTLAVLPDCVERKIPLVVATTGHTPQQRAQIEAAAHQTALLMAPNMSLAVNVLMKLVRQAAEALRDKGFDVEIPRSVPFRRSCRLKSSETLATDRFSASSGRVPSSSPNVFLTATFA